MPILTKNETPAKGAKAEFELDKTALAAVTSVAADSYFSDTSNWKSVEMIFKSNPGNQRRTVKFDASQALPLANFFASAKARDIFEIEKIVINDLDGGEFIILRSELTTSEFDIDMGTTPSAYDYISYNINAYGYVVSPTGGVTSGPLPLGDDHFVKSSDSESVGDFDYQWSFNWTGVYAYNMFVGITTTGGSVWYNNLSCIEGTDVNTYRLWFGGAPIPGTQTLSTGNHTFRLVRTGSTLYYYLDDVLVHSGSSVTGTAQPTVRAYLSNIACTQSIKVI